MRTEVIWQAWREVGLLPHQVLIWKKTRAVLTYSHFMWDYEPMMYGWREGHMPAAKPPAEAKAVWEIASGVEDGAAGIHPTQKPVETIRRPILYHTRPAELIYEPFSGSGTALIAAEQTQRRCCAIEQSPEFVDVAVQRWQNFTGREATLPGDGCSFAEVAAKRRSADACGARRRGKCAAEPDAYQGCIEDGRRAQAPGGQRASRHGRKLWTRRLTQEEIAVAVGVDQSTISRDIKVLVAAWRETALGDVTDTRARELADLDAMEREAAMAASGDVSPQELARLLEVRLRVKERRSRLLGLDAPQRQEVTRKGNETIRYDFILDGLSDEELEQAILEEAERITSRATASPQPAGPTPSQPALEK